MFELNVWENRPIDPHFFNANQDTIAPTSPLEIKTASSQPTQLLGSEDVSQQLPDTLETQLLKGEEILSQSPEAEMLSNSFKGFSGSISSVYRSRDYDTSKKLGKLTKEEPTNSQNNDELTGISANFSTQSVNPDVIISNLSAPTIIEAGQSTRIEYTITNQGNGDVDNWSQTKFYLSSDTTLDATDTYLTSDYNYDWSLSADGSSSEVAYFTLNQTLDLDNYYLLAQVDANNEINESNETNNLAYQQITIGEPDLIISNLSAPTTIEAGQSTRIEYTITNQGNGDVHDWSQTKFYLSTDTTLDANDTYLTSDYNYDWYLSAGGSSSEFVSFTLDQTLDLENYYLLAQVDANNEISESNENNNLAYQQVTIGEPDVILSNLWDPTIIEAGQSTRIDYTITNQGNGDVDTYWGWSQTKFYLSTDTTLDANDTYLTSDYNYDRSLSVGESSSEYVYLTLDHTLEAGNYYLIAQADANNEISESNENNNLAYQQITVTEAQLADLAITDISVSDSITAGSYADVTYTINNFGNIASQSYIGASIYFSTDAVFDSSDQRLTTDYPDSIASGESVTLSNQIYFDVMESGTYYLFVKADHYDLMEEWDESNNLASIAININPSVDGYSVKSGYGLINAAAAVAEAINQPTFADVPDLGGDYWGADLVNAPEVWNAGYTGEGVIVAVLDTGVDRNHDDLKDNIWTNTGEIAGNGIDDDGNGYIDDVYGWDFTSDSNHTLDIEGHGTHVAGTIAGVKNDFGVIGIAYNAQIMPVQVLNDSGTGSWEGLAEGIRYAVNNGADVINMSLEGSNALSSVGSAIEYAASKGVIVVSAAGNNSDSTTMGHDPASYATDWGLAVGAVDQSNEMAGFSNRSGETKLAYVTAPGVSVLSTTPNNSYDSYSGTSMAAPHVAGVVALMLEANPNLTDAQVRQIVTGTAQNTQYI